MKAIECFLHVVLFNMLHRAILTFNSVHDSSDLFDALDNYGSCNF